MTQHRAEDLNGWPELDRVPVVLPELGESASPPMRARAYATVLASWYRLWGQLVEAFDFVRGLWTAVDARTLQLLEGQARLEEKLDRLLHRPKLPSLPGWADPEQTDGGSLHFRPEQLQAWQAKLADLAERAERAEREKALAVAREEGAREALAVVEQRAEAAATKWRNRVAIAIWAPVLTVAGGLVAWVVRELVHR